MSDIDLDAIEWPRSIRGINNLDAELKRAIYRSLIPGNLLERFGVHPDDEKLLQIKAPAHTRSVKIILYHEPNAPDPVLYLHMADTLNFQIALLLLVINDPYAPRFNTDVDENGLPTRFGTLRRNIPEEIRAMEAGLSPGQVRRGLRLSGQAVPTFERFLARAGHDMVIIEPLTYHNAIIYERYGFAYFQGRQRLEWIDRVLRPGGEFFDRFDGSTPFRQPDAWRSIRGRSWAIHDGILGEPFGDIRMYKRIGKHAGVNTFPDAIW
ncbi:MAG: hypothetical protein WBH90_12075 [Aggregatilineales bacterium]